MSSTVFAGFEGAGAISAFLPQLSLIEAPYLWRDAAHMARLQGTPLMGRLNDDLVAKRGMRMVAVTYYGKRHLTSGSKAVRSPASAAGGPAHTTTALASQASPRRRATSTAERSAAENPPPSTRTFSAHPMEQVDRIVAEQLTMSDMIEREARWVAAFFAASIWTGDYTGVASSPTGSQFLQWDNSASDPITDVKNAKSRAFLAMGGIEPNVMVMSKLVWDVLEQHPDIIDRIKYGQTPGAPAMVTKEIVAALFGVDRIVVAAAIQDTSVDGPATTTTLAYIAGKHVGLFYVPPAPGLMQMAPGYTFAWNGYLGLGSGNYNAMGSRIRNWRQESIRSDVFEIESAIDMKLVCADAGIMLLSAVA